MAKSNKANRSEPVDASAIDQTPAAEKPSREALAKSGYTIPEHWDALEQGEPVETADAKPLSEINRDADTAQRESLKAEEGHTAAAGASKHYSGQYGVGGAKASAGPAENKAADSKKK